MTEFSKICGITCYFKRFDVNKAGIFGELVVVYLEMVVYMCVLSD